MEQLTKPCSYHIGIDCPVTCYSCEGCGWTEIERRKRSERIRIGLSERNGRLFLNLGRKSKRVCKKVDYAKVQELHDSNYSAYAISMKLGCNIKTVAKIKRSLGITGRIKRIDPQYKLLDLDKNILLVGSAKECGEFAGVTASTITNWIKNKPAKAKYLVEVAG